MVWMGLWIALALIAAPQRSWGNQTERQSCVSSCGKITNISHPFRRKDDPPNCGDRRFELECVNDVALLRLPQQAAAEHYQVQAINYNNYTIRLVDPYIQEANCSSLPRYFLSRSNFTDSVNVYDTAQLRGPDDYAVLPLFGHIIYMSCNATVSSSGCLDLHTYAVAGDLSAGEWKAGCHVKLIALTSALSQLQQQYPYFGWGEDAEFPTANNKNISYSDMHRALAYGFELSWLGATCPKHNCGTFGRCYFNPATQEVRCVPPTCSLSEFPNLRTCGIRRVIHFLIAGFLSLASDFLKGMYRLIRFHNDDVDPNLDHVETAKEGWYTLLLFLSSRVLFGVTLLIVLLIYKWRRRHLSTYVNIENFLQDNDLAPIRYSYKEIKKMTKNFNVKLGHGGFGSVYKGKLRSGPHVAIKMLKQSKGSGQDFINEVATIGTIHHVNVVRLIGFCVEGSKRALVYDFLSNGSLDKYIFSKEGSIPLSYQKIHEISLGIACGISYLHHGCDMQILHFDIKPHNILLDEDFIPKVSDFGLAKLYPIDHSMVTLTDQRGTIGYIAPELFYNNIGRISYKADVYSFGRLLMEMANRQTNLNSQTEDSSEILFPAWVYDQFNEGKEIELDNDNGDEKNIAKKMIIVALWCIQLKPSDRPSMKRVVEMLEGELEDLTMPPKPLLYPNETTDMDNSLTLTSDDSTIATSDFSEATTSNPILDNSLYGERS